MKHYDHTIDLEKAIEGIEGLNDKNISSFNEAIKLCQNTLLHFRNTIVKDGFNSPDDEIIFFKIIKQKPLENLLFYSTLKRFYLKFPKGDKVRQKKVLSNKIKQLNKVFRSNYEFNQYMEQGLTNLDEYYFTRKYSYEFSTIFSVPFFRDPEFSTSHDFLLAKLNSHLKLVRYFEQELHKLRNPSFQEIPKSKLKWTSSKVALTGKSGQSEPPIPV